jgi:peptidylprolyl isomerase
VSGKPSSRIVVLVVLLVGLVAAGVIVAATGDDDSASGGDVDLSVKPDVELPGGEPPTELETEDVVVGDGAEAAVGDTISVQYVGVTYSDGSEFDASWDTGEPFEFRLGSGSVIPGWDEGIPGMKVGGRRELVIPPDLAYGPQGQPPDIGPNETLIFVVDLLDVTSTQ